MTTPSRLVFAALIVVSALVVSGVSATPASSVIPGDGGNCTVTVHNPYVSFGNVVARADVNCNSPYNWHICIQFLDWWGTWQIPANGCTDSGVPFGVGYPAHAPSSFFA